LTKTDIELIIKRKNIREFEKNNKNWKEFVNKYKYNDEYLEINN